MYLHDPADPSSLSNNAVGKLFIDHTGKMWLATWDGFDCFDPNTGRFAVYKRDWQSRTESYYDIAEDQKGGLWLGGTSGLQHFDPATREFRAYEHNLNDPRSLSDNRVTSVHIDRSGTVWAATQNGLDKLDRDSGMFTQYYVKDGLPSNRVHCILEDERGDLWMSTNKGLSRLDSVTKTFKNYSASDGLPGMDLTGWLTCFRSPTGEMFFGGFSGATAFYPDRVVDIPYVPPIVFTDFRLSGHSVEVGPGSPLKKSINYAENLTLTHTQNTFSLEFAALDYSNLSSNRYRYRLDGLDSQWNEAPADQRVVNYTALPAGKYTFHVEMATGQSGWSASGATLHIEVLPPWWGTWWFRTTCAALIVLIGFAAYSYRMHQIAQQFEMRLEERVSERTRIARELHDTLLQSLHGLLLRFQAARNMLPRRLEEAMESLDGAIMRTEQAIAESRDTIKDLRSERIAPADLAELLTETGRELESAGDSNGNPPVFRVTVEGQRQALAPALQEEVYRIARELLRNAFRHACAQRIEAEIRYDSHLLRVRIRDDGKGMDPRVLREGGHPGHWGLPGVRERAQRVGAKVDFWSEAEVGTEVQLTVPGTIAYNLPGDRTGFWRFRRPKAS